MTMALHGERKAVDRWPPAPAAVGEGPPPSGTNACVRAYACGHIGMRTCMPVRARVRYSPFLFLFKKNKIAKTVLKQIYPNSFFLTNSASES